MKYAVYTLFAFILVGCGTQKEIESVDETAINVDSKPEKEIIIATLGEPKRSDAITINSARIEGNLMYLIVEYSGGCQEHAFELTGSFAVAKSIPPQRGIQLYHNANGDNCRALITDTLIANIEALAAAPTKGSEIFLNLEGYGKQLKYIYE
jgi:hypothetical protein